MARIARVVIPNYPHHILQRGNRRQPVFFNDTDKQTQFPLMPKQNSNRTDGREPARVTVPTPQTHFLVIQCVNYSHN